MQRLPPEAAAAGLAQPPSSTSLPHVTQEGLPLPPHTPSPRLPPPSSVLCHAAREVRSSWASSVRQVTTQEEIDMGAELESRSDDRGEQGKQAGQSPRTPASGGRPSTRCCCPAPQTVGDGTGALRPGEQGMRGRGPRAIPGPVAATYSKAPRPQRGCPMATTVIYPPLRAPLTLCRDLTSGRPSPVRCHHSRAEDLNSFLPTSRLALCPLPRASGLTQLLSPPRQLGGRPLPLLRTIPTPTSCLLPSLQLVPLPLLGAGSL